MGGARDVTSATAIGGAEHDARPNRGWRPEPEGSPLSPKLLAVLAIPAALLLPAAVAAPAEAAEGVTVTHTTAPAVAPRHSRHWLHCHTRAQPCAVPRPAPRVTNARARVVAAARRYLGQPYVYGRLDCSSLTQRAYAAIGKHIPRTAAGQYAAGRRVTRARIADVLVYGGGTHVALVTKVSAAGRVLMTEVARHTGTVVGFQKPYEAYRVVSFLA